MKNVIARPAVIAAVLLIATFTQPAAALPRYAYSDTFYAADYEYATDTYCRTFENGHDTLNCNGVRDRSGTLDGVFRYSYQYECSTNIVVYDQWFFYSHNCGSWIPVGANPYCKIDNEC